MKLFDRVAMARTPFIVQDCRTQRIGALNNTADCAQDVAQCPLRFVLTDELTRLCTALAYSKGSRTLECTDLLRVPAALLWIEWCNTACDQELSEYGFPIESHSCPAGGRRGALLRASLDGRRGMVRTFWTQAGEDEALASCVEGYFDFDVPSTEDPEPFDGRMARVLRVVDGAHSGEDVLSRCFRFRYERTWQEYYDGGNLSAVEWAAIDHHALGTIAIAVPVILAFLLLLGSRTGLAQRPASLTRLNRSRAKSGKPPLLDHVEVSCPLLPAYPGREHSHAGGFRRRPRLHHVRGHLVRRGNELFWRVPHLRGSARVGRVHARTVTWTFDPRSNG